MKFYQKTRLPDHIWCIMHTNKTKIAFGIKYIIMVDEIPRYGTMQQRRLYRCLPEKDKNIMSKGVKQ